MTHEQKTQVKDALMRYTRNADTNAPGLAGINAEALLQIQDNNWEAVGEDLWQSIARQVGFYTGHWHTADTSVQMLMRILLNDATNYTNNYCISAATGAGKTHAATYYARRQPGSIYIVGNSAYNRKTFLSVLLRQLGDEPADSVPVMCTQLLSAASMGRCLLIIIDDAHLLRDRVLGFMARLMKKLTAQAGWAIIGDNSMPMRIVEGIRMGRPGFEDIYRLAGQRFVRLQRPGPNDVALVCRDNGVNDTSIINYISESCAGNLHHAACLVSQYTQQKMAA